MEMRMPDGKLLSEEFETTEALFKRFDELSAKGGKVEKITIGADEVLRQKRKLSRMLGRP